jgi:signal transduction histidine kinase
VLVFVMLALVPLIGLSLYGYLSGMRTVGTLLREETSARVANAASRAERIVDNIQERLLIRSRAAVAHDFLRAANGVVPAANEASLASRVVIPDAVGEHFSMYMRNNRRYVESLTAFDATGRPLFRAPTDSGDPASSDHVPIQTEFLPGEVRYDNRIRGRAPGDVLRFLTQERYGPALRMGIAVRDETTGQELGSFFVEIRLTDVFAEADASAESAPASELSASVAGAALPDEPTSAEATETRAARLRHPLVALDHESGLILYHTNDSLKHQPVASAMPYFRELAESMAANESGFGYYEAPGGHRWLAVYRRVRGLPVSIAVADDYTEATAPVRRLGLWGVGLALLAGGVALALLTLIIGRAIDSVERVARGASAIAAGDIEQRIEVRSGDEMRELAENFNRMSDRLREMIAREAETKQFESFMRLSAMLTHDLKNAITALSMLVSNMERQYHREEFRADAIESVREATEKLRRIVARLNEPVVSLSGEYRRNMRPTDLVPLIRRVIDAHIIPHGPLYELEVRLPEKLAVTVEPDRIENVIENLVLNAIEAMGPRGGRLVIEAGREGDYVSFSVADTGAGMSRDFIRTRLFRPFSTTKSKGIGLGLYTVREIVEAHGGRIDVESEVGAGTCFRVVLPSRLFSSGERR